MRPTCNSGDEQVVGSIENLVIEVAYLRMDIEDIIGEAREHNAKKLTTPKKEAVKRKRNAINVLRKKIIFELKKLPACEQVRLSAKIPLLKMLVERATKNMQTVQR